MEIEKKAFLAEVGSGPMRLALSESDGMLPSMDAEGNSFVLAGNRTREVEILEEDHFAGKYLIRVDGNTFSVKLFDEVRQRVLQMNLPTRTAGRSMEMRAPMPGLVRQVNVEEGSSVTAGDPLIVLEAMKMENLLKSPMSGTIVERCIQPGQAVEKNQLLLRFS